MKVRSNKSAIPLKYEPGICCRYLRDGVGDDNGGDGSVSSGKNKHDKCSNLCGEHNDDLRRYEARA